MSLEGCEIGFHLVLLTNRKMQVGFPLIPELVTLNGVMAVIVCPLTKFGGFGYGKVVEVRSVLSVTAV